MKVMTAAQKFRSSVADAIEFMMLSGHPFLQNAEATFHLIHRFFDLLNVKNPYNKSFKQPLKLCNQIMLSQRIDNSIEHLLTLKAMITFNITSWKNVCCGFITAAKYINACIKANGK